MHRYLGAAIAALILVLPATANAQVGRPVDRFSAARDLGERGITLATQDDGFSSRTLQPSADWAQAYQGVPGALFHNAVAPVSLAVPLVAAPSIDGMRSESQEGVVHVGRSTSFDGVGVKVVFERKDLQFPLETTLEIADDGKPDTEEAPREIGVVAGDFVGDGTQQIAVGWVEHFQRPASNPLGHARVMLAVLRIRRSDAGLVWERLGTHEMGSSTVVHPSGKRGEALALGSGQLLDSGGEPAHDADGNPRPRRDQIALYMRRQTGAQYGTSRLAVLDMTSPGSLEVVEDEPLTTYLHEAGAQTQSVEFPENPQVRIVTPSNRQRAQRVGASPYTGRDAVVLMATSFQSSSLLVDVGLPARQALDTAEDGHIRPRRVGGMSGVGANVVDVDVDVDGMGEIVLVAGTDGCNVTTNVLRGKAGRTDLGWEASTSVGIRGTSVPRDANTDIACDGSQGLVGDIVVADTRTVKQQGAAGAMLPSASAPAVGAPQVYIAQNYTATETDIFGGTVTEDRGWVHELKFEEMPSNEGGGLRLSVGTGREVEPVTSIAGPAFDGRIRLGRPKHRRTVRQEPLVLLNASPTHFDTFGGEVFDPHFCWGDNLFAVPEVCFFKTTYERTQAATQELTSTVNEDWAVDSKLELSGELGPIEIKNTITGHYGEQYTKVDGTTATEAITVSATAKNVDQAYTLTKAYDTLEYPIYDVDDDPSTAEDDGYILHVSPTVVKKQWIDITGPLSFLRNSHQPGNLLSYARPEDIDDVPFLAAGSTPFGEDEFQITPTSDFTYTLDRERVDNSSGSTQIRWGVGTTFEFDADIVLSPKLEVSGGYKKEEIRTATTTFGDKTRIQARLAQIDGSLGQLSYLVKPFAYYTKGGALVIDYAVEPDRSPNGVDTFWDRFYGTRPDPTMILPHYQEAERFGRRALTTDALQFETRDLEFLLQEDGICAESPEGVPTPAVGEDICFQLNARNYSLDDLPAGSKVRFYAGDPDVGGVEIVPDGVSLAAMEPRTTRRVQALWKPSAAYAGQRVRVFAVVDADGSVREVHEDNNKGFNVLRVDAPTSPEPGNYAPRDVNAETVDDTTALVSWSAPLDLPLPSDAEFVVRGYLDGDPVPALERTLDPTDADVVPGAEFELSVAGVAEPGRYRFAVLTRADGEVGPVSDPSEPLALAQLLPGVPSDVTISGTDVSVLSWTAPEWTGVDGSGEPTPITGYEIVLRPAGGGTDVVRTVSALTSRLELRELACGAEYDVTVATLSSQGRGAASAPVRFTYTGPPSAPTRLLASSAADGSATVTWSAPSQLCGATLTGYEVTAHPGDRKVTTAAATRTATFTDLPLGTNVTFTVVARSDRGDSSPSAASNQVLVARAPGAVTEVVVDTGPGRARINWRPPAQNGGAPITGYVVEVVPEGGAPIIQGTDAFGRSVTFEHLVNGRRHTYSVRATNSAGQSAATGGSFVPYGLASAPTVVTARGGDGSATVEWRAPADDGGRPIEQYIVTASPGDRSVLVGHADRAAVIGGLANGGRYRFTVAAITAQGRGAESAASDEVLVARAPDAPRGIAVEPGVLRLDVRWDAPAFDGGAPITAYRVTAKINGRTRQVTVDGRARSATIEGLVLLLPHTVSVQAVNDRGEGPVATAGSTFTPLALPPAPVVVVSGTVGLTPLSLDGTVTLGLRSASSKPKVTSWDTRMKWSGASGGWSDWVEPAAWQQSRTATRQARLAAGTTVCFASRGHTDAGDRTAWSRPQCTTRAISRSTLVKRRWRLRTGPATAVSIVTSGCRRCGAVVVRMDGKPVKTVRVAGGRRVVRVTLPHRRGGTVSLRGQGGRRVAGIRAVAVHRVDGQDGGGVSKEARAPRVR